MVRGDGPTYGGVDDVVVGHYHAKFEWRELHLFLSVSWLLLFVAKQSKKAMREVANPT